MRVGGACLNAINRPYDDFGTRRDNRRLSPLTGSVIRIVVARRGLRWRLVAAICPRLGRRLAVEYDALNFVNAEAMFVTPFVREVDGIGRAAGVPAVYLVAVCQDEHLLR